MTRVAFYFDNQHLPELNYDTILDGNPGIGGTEYMIMVISRLLQLRDNDITPFIYATGRRNQIYNDATVTEVNNITEAIKLSEKEGCEYLIFKHERKLIKDKSLHINSSVKLIPWCHVFLYEYELDNYNTNPCIYKVVYVGKEQMDLYRDHALYKKSTYIFNCINTKKTAQQEKTIKQNIITYMGAIMPYKGLHWLTDIWPQINTYFPDAELYIIGSGKLYGTNHSDLGPYKIAQSDYESYILKNLTQNGEILKNIHFCGILGQDKEDIIKKSKVCIANPTGNTETFCITAVEMQQMGGFVVTGVSPGAIDTIYNGILVRDKRELKKAIIKVLQDRVNWKNPTEYINNHFSQDVVIRQWEALLHGDKTYGVTLSNPFYRFKWLKEIIRILGIHKTCKIPTVERILLFIERHFFDLHNNCHY